MPDSDAALPDPLATRGAALAASLAAVDGLAELGESIEEEWSYVTELAEAGRARLRAAAGDALEAPLAGDRGAAVAAACAEAARVEDPHRAIDWLSTLPAIIELALAAPAPPAAPAAAGPRPA